MADGDGKRVDAHAATQTPVPGELRARARTRSDTKASGDQIGRYTIRERIGAGGMAVVYAAWDAQLNRQVALKVLQSRLVEHMSGRLMREAQSMAQLSHPNVVTVFEVGVEEDELFICMEHVAGTNLREWLQAKPRSLREIVATFVAAGRGLESAHRARIVHRDFKPDNVLIDTEGRVRVTDFGLAREMGEHVIDAPRESYPRLDHPSLTVSGDLMGTPIYMAPELLAGGTADASSDQYAYCVALYEAVYGVPPYSGKTFAELISKVADEKFDPVPDDRKVPRWLRAVLHRGMAPKPADRFPTMSALIAELEHDRGALVRRIAIGALGVIAIGLAVAIWLRPQPSKGPVCSDPTAKLAAVWDPQRRARVEEAFRATRLPHAEASVRTAVTLLDGYAASWRKMDVESCEASLVRAEQTPELFQLRSLCLEKRKTELAAAVSLLERPDPQVVGRVDEVLGSLESIDQCANAAALLEVVPPPTGAGETIGKVEAALSEASLQLELGKFERADEIVGQATKLMGTLDYPPLGARLLTVQGTVEAKRGKLDEAERHLLAAISAAERGRDDRRKVVAFAELQHLVGWEREDFQRAETYVQLAEAALDRAGDDRELRSELLKNAATVAYTAGNIQLAFDRTAEAFRLAELVYGPTHPKVAKLHNQVAVSLTAVGKLDEAVARHRKALSLLETSYGSNHPDYAIVLNDMADTLARAGKYDEAEEALRRSHSIIETAFGKGHAQTAKAISNLASVRYLRGDAAAAATMFRDALAIEQETLGGDHTSVASTLVNLGAVETSLGETDHAEATLRRALAIREQHLPTGDSRIYEVTVLLGNLLVETKRYADARPLLERAVGGLTGRTSATVAEAQFGLARALWGLGLDRVRARELATTAQRIQTELGDAGAAQAIGTWLTGR